MSSNTYQFGLLLVVFGGFLMLGRTQFGADSGLLGQFGLFIMFFGAIVGTLGLVGTSSTSGEE